MTHIECKAVLFDLDGVLIDSTAAIERVWTRWAMARGFDPKEVLAAAHGRPSLAVVQEYLPDSDHEKESLEAERCEMEDLEGVVACSGARELLAALNDARWTVVTSCSRDLVEAKLLAVGMPIAPLMVTFSDVEHGKPHPEPYLKGAARLKCLPSDCLVLEDAPAGVQSGKAAGCRVIGMRTWCSEKELKAAGADWIIDSCASVRVLGHSGQVLRLALEAAIK
jgi:sugar-phosphatase